MRAIQHSYWTILAAMILLASCGDRSARSDDQDEAGAAAAASGSDVGVSADGPGSLLPDAGAIAFDAGALPVDAAINCGDAPLAMGFVVAETGGPTDPDQTSEFNGVVVYHGPITEPMASLPLFNREVRLDDPIADGHTLVVQYYLPEGRELPVKEQGHYTFVVKRRWVGETTGEGLPIRRNTSGLWPLIFVAEPAAYGQAFALDDPLFAPIKVALIEQGDCEVASAACGRTFVDRLRISASTGAAINEIELGQGETGALSVFGNEFFVANLRSQHVIGPCEDHPSIIVAYLLTLAD